MRLIARAIGARLLASTAAGAVPMTLPLLAGCATKPPANDPDAVADFKATNDTFEPTKRFFYRVNDALLTNALIPAARGYNAAVPQPVRGGIHNMLNNLGQPVQFVNDVLETRPRRAGDSFMRFVINSTVGLGGIFDVAKRAGYPDHDADGASTLALWGIPAGPYLYLPVFGPSGLRDEVGRRVDAAVNPLSYISFDGSNTLGWCQAGFGALDQTARHVKELQQVKADALDPYVTFRSLYRQLRNTETSSIRDDHRATVPDWYAKSGANGATRPAAPQQPTPRPALTHAVTPVAPPG